MGSLKYSATIRFFLGGGNLLLFIITDICSLLSLKSLFLGEVYRLDLLIHYYQNKYIKVT